MSHALDTLCPQGWTRFLLAPSLRIAGRISPMKLRRALVLDTRLVLLGAFAILASCSDGSAMSEAQVKEVRTQVEGALVNAYDLSKPGVLERMLSLYPKTGRVVSTSVGRVITSRDSLEGGIRYFNENVVANMQGARWIWDAMFVDVLSPTSAVVTASYHIPHKTPRGQDHVIAGAMTAVFVKRDGQWAIIQEHLSDVPPAPDAPSMEPMPASTKKSP